ncbi:MAG: aminoglycoside phosphotransferase family protein [Verrucomicrobiae bacterium]|nr:aminoglycoside phosphotransferase family protein [Verrucomicrobiae bacterium]
MNKIRIDGKLAHRLVATQFPQWKNLSIQAVADQGWDNRTFRLGEQMLVRLPSAERYAQQVEKEHRWLPKLAPFLPLRIPVPVAMGESADNYSWRWSIYRWLEGEPATSAPIENLSDLAKSLAEFLLALQRIDAAGGPLAGPQSFYRGGTLANYDAQLRRALDILKGKIDVDVATKIWEAALATVWQEAPVWVHGDVSPTNLLVRENKLNAVIDFGQLTIGDPACDLTITWTLFQGESRELFRSMFPFDAATWTRARAWTLWKFVIAAAGLTSWNALGTTRSWEIIEDVLADHQCKDRVVISIRKL